MNRCLVCLIFSLGCSAALAQSGRDADRNSGVVLIVPEDTMATGDGLGRVFPPNARRGVMRVVAWPEVLLDGKPERLSPGARIRDTQNMLTQPAGLTGVSLVVNYRKNSGGELQDVWLLSAAEAKVKRPDPAAGAPVNTGIGPGQKDTGNVPFDQLPKWNPNTLR